MHSLPSPPRAVLRETKADGLARCRRTILLVGKLGLLGNDGGLKGRMGTVHEITKHDHRTEHVVLPFRKSALLCRGGRIVHRLSESKEGPRNGLRDCSPQQDPKRVGRLIGHGVNRVSAAQGRVQDTGDPLSATSAVQSAFDHDPEDFLERDQSTVRRDHARVVNGVVDNGSSTRRRLVGLLGRLCPLRRPQHPRVGNCTAVEFRLQVAPVLLAVETVEVELLEPVGWNPTDIALGKLLDGRP